MGLSSVADRSAGGTFLAGFWRLADPKISLASLAAVTLGALAAAGGGALSVTWLAATIVAVLAIEIAKNASGEIYDFDSGTDLAACPASTPGRDQSRRQ
jgi:1,4-dihydroxy-2-naphthoate octaprenyltransferase